MLHWKTALGILIGVGLIGSGIAVADPSGGKGVVGLKLIIIDKYFAANKAKLVFVSKDKTLGAIHKGVSSAPPNITGTAEVIDLNDPSNVAVFDMPETNDNQTGTWLVNKPTVAKYVNKGASPGDKGVKVAVVKPGKVLKVVAKNLGDGDDDTGDQSASDFDAGAIEEGDVVRVRVTIDNTANFPPDTHVMCTDFVITSVKEIAGNTGFKVISKKDSVAPADGTCGGVGTTTTTATTSTTSTTISSPMGAVLEFISGAAGGTCGESREGGAAGTILETLTCGGLNIGGGCFEGGTSCGVAEGPTPAGAATQLNAACGPTSCALSARTSGETGTNTNCTDTGCQFGTWLSIANGGTSTCVLNTFASPAFGTLDLTTGAFDGSFPLTSAVTLTGNGASPCPECSAGTCDGSAANPGASCTATNGSGDSYECVPAGLPLTPFPVDLTPINTGTTFFDTFGGDPGIFCPGQDDIEPGSRGCFRSTKDHGVVCDYIEERGSVAGAMSIGGGTSAVTLGSVFCIPAAGNGLIDGAADLPGPGATSLPGTFELF